MHSVSETVAAVKACPMPLPLKEQILDQLFGSHDGLSRPERKIKTRRPMAERVGEAREIGAFDFIKVLPSGDLVYAYCKKGVPFYRVLVRGDEAVHCTCKDFEIESAREPGYDCKHLILWREMGLTLEEAAQEAADAAGAFERLWLLNRAGRATDAEVNAAYAVLESARRVARQIAECCAGRDTVTLTNAGRAALADSVALVESSLTRAA